MPSVNVFLDIVISYLAPGSWHFPPRITPVFAVLWRCWEGGGNTPHVLFSSGTVCDKTLSV